VKEEHNPYQTKALSSEPAVNSAPVYFSMRALLGSLLVMLPWPMIGIGVCLGLSLFEELGEAVFMFGSVTMIFLLPLALVVNSMWIFGALSVFVWLLVLVLPFCFGKSPIHRRFHFHTVLVCQTLFSAIQAGVGFLVVLGKYC
jgi:hypothetical protein